MKDQVLDNVTNQRGYSWLLKFSMPDHFCMHIHQQYINVLWMFYFMFSFSDLHSECVDIVSSAYNSIHIPHYVSHIGWGHMLWGPDICQNVFIDIEKTMLKLYSWDDIAWFIILYCVCILFPEIMMGIISWCFYQKPESLLCQFEISITLTNFPFFFFLFGVGL